MSISLFSNGEIVNIKASNERVIILKSHYVKNMKRFTGTPYRLTECAAHP